MVREARSSTKAEAKPGGGALRPLPTAPRLAAFPAGRLTGGRGDADGGAGRAGPSSCREPWRRRRRARSWSGPPRERAGRRAGEARADGRRSARRRRGRERLRGRSAGEPNSGNDAGSEQKEWGAGTRRRPPGETGNLPPRPKRPSRMSPAKLTVWGLWVRCRRSQGPLHGENSQLT